MDVFFCGGGVTPHEWRPDSYVQWDMSQAPEECLSVSREAHDELRQEMSERRFRFFLAHAHTDDFHDFFEDPEGFFKRYEQYDEQDDSKEWRCECARGTPIPDDDRESYLEARRDESHAQLRARRESRERWYEERRREVQSYPWVQRLASARGSRGEPDVAAAWARVIDNAKSTQASGTGSAY